MARGGAGHSLWHLLELVLWGRLIEPMRVSKWTAVAFVFGAAVVWIAGQVLLGRRLPDLFNPQIEREIERLREEAIALSNWIVLGPTADIWPKHCPVCPADKGES